MKVKILKKIYTIIIEILKEELNIYCQPLFSEKLWYFTFEIMVQFFLILLYLLSIKSNTKLENKKDIKSKS